MFYFILVVYFLLLIEDKITKYYDNIKSNKLKCEYEPVLSICKVTMSYDCGAAMTSDYGQRSIMRPTVFRYSSSEQSREHITSCLLMPCPDIPASAHYLWEKGNIHQTFSPRVYHGVAQQIQCYCHTITNNWNDISTIKKLTLKESVMLGEWICLTARKVL